MTRPRLPESGDDLPNNGYGVWLIFRHGGLMEDMRGYGLSWAHVRAAHWGSAMWCRDVTVQFRPVDQTSPTAVYAGASLVFDATPTKV